MVSQTSCCATCRPVCCPVPNVGWLPKYAMPNALVRSLRSVNLCEQLRHRGPRKHDRLAWNFLRRMSFHRLLYQDCFQPGPEFSRPKGQPLAASGACDRVRDRVRDLVCSLQKCLPLIQNRCRHPCPLADAQTGPCGRRHRQDPAGRQPLVPRSGQIVVDEYRLRSRATSCRRSDPELVSKSLKVKSRRMNQRHSLNHTDHSKGSHSNRCRRSHSSQNTLVLRFHSNRTTGIRSCRIGKNWYTRAIRSSSSTQARRKLDFHTSQLPTSHSSTAHVQGSRT